MKRTAPVTLALLALGGAVVAFLLELALAASGNPIMIPPISLPLTLLALAIVVVLLAWPVRRAVKASVKVHVDPFRALRVAVLAKASALAGALLGGAGLGLVIYLLTRQGAPVTESLWLSISMAAGGIVLMVAGLIAEHFCVLPPDDENPDDELPDAKLAHGSHA